MATRAEILCVGSELLLPGRIESNGEVLTSRLFGLGIPVRRRGIVPDDEADLPAALREALGRSPLVVVTGGLGPTEDDRTREAAARALGVALRRDAGLEASLRARALSRGRTWNEASLRQADLPEGAEPIPNEAGTAPGIWFEREGSVLVILPGVPSELLAMWDGSVAPRLAPLGGAPGCRRTLRTTGVPEPEVQTRLPEVPAGGVERVITCSPEGIDVHLVAWGEGAARVLDAEAERTAGALGEAVYAGEGGVGLPEVVGSLLAGRSETLATAESCTGGLLGHRITEVAGSSGYYRRGYVVYSNEAKSELMGVPEGVIEEHGAVSEPVARALAEGASRHADWGIGITGIAGPSGGSEEKPVGTVHFAVARRGGSTAHRRRRFGGSRSEIKIRATQAALDLLRRCIQGLPISPRGG